MVYGRRSRQSDLEHELRVTDFSEFFIGCPFSRDAKVGTTTADALLPIRGQVCYVEIDNTGNMSRAQMTAKWKRYPRDLKGFILVVAMTESRMERLRTWEGSELVKDVALYSTPERLRAGRPWTDWYGKTVVI